MLNSFIYTHTNIPIIITTEERLKAFFPPFIFVAVAIICSGILEFVDSDISTSVLLLIIGICFGVVDVTLISERYRRFTGEKYDVLRLSAKGQIIRVAFILLFIVLSVYVVLTAHSPFTLLGAGMVFGAGFGSFTLNMQNTLHESTWLQKHMTKIE